MNEPFELPVWYKGEELLFPVQLKQAGYSHLIVVDVYGQDVVFEPDEERNYKAIVQAETLPKQVSPELLRAIAEE